MTVISCSGQSVDYCTAIVNVVGVTAFQVVILKTRVLFLCRRQMNSLPAMDISSRV